ncbi:MAG: CynX/NimT family MFS transporter [Paracoccaceae bacterium]
MILNPSILDSRTAWSRLGLTLCIALVANAGMWIAISVLPAVETEFTASRAWSSMPYTLTMIGFALGNFGVGKLVDMLGVTRSLQGAAIVSAGAYGAAAMSPDIVSLSLIHFFLGVGTSVGFGPLIADISHWFLRQRGLAVALVASGNYLSGTIWPVALSDTIASGDWRSVYWTMAAITLVVMLPLSMTLRRKIPAEATHVAQAQAQARAATTGLSNRSLALLLGCAGIGCCVAMSMPQVHIIAYCVGLGYGPAVGQQMLALMLLGGVVSRVISGLVADTLGGARTLLIGATLQCLALFLYLPWDGLVSLYLISAVFGLSQGGIVPSYAVVVREYMPAKDAGAWVGFVIMMTVLGMAIGGWMSGWIYDLTGSYQAAFWNGIVWNGMNIAIISWLLLRTRRQPPMTVPA